MYAEECSHFAPWLGWLIVTGAAVLAARKVWEEWHG